MSLTLSELGAWVEDINEVAQEEQAQIEAIRKQQSR
jgi:hypothetical protein